jgi:hypothetical protein
LVGRHSSSSSGQGRTRAIWAIAHTNTTGDMAAAPARPANFAGQGGWLTALKQRRADWIRNGARRPHAHPPDPRIGRTGPRSAPCPASLFKRLHLPACRITPSRAARADCRTSGASSPTFLRRAWILRQGAAVSCSVTPHERALRRAAPPVYHSPFLRWKIRTKPVH